MSGARSVRAAARTRALALLVVTGLLLCGLLSRQAMAGPTITHSVRPGDSIELLAAEYYGNRQLAVFILAANALSHERKLRAGMKLRIPTSWRYRSKAGDTLAQIALAELGDARRADYLAGVNQLEPGRALESGVELMIPFQIKHRTAGVESFRDIARAYYGDTRRADLIRSYNFRTGAESTANDQLAIPIEHVRVRPSKLPLADPADAAQAAAKLKDLAVRVREAIGRADARTREGRFEEVVGLLLPLLSGDADPGEAELMDIHWLLGHAYVALDQKRLALASFRELVARRPKLLLDPARVSPKVRAVFEQARKPAESEKSP